MGDVTDATMIHIAAFLGAVLWSFLANMVVPFVLLTASSYPKRRNVTAATMWAVSLMAAVYGAYLGKMYGATSIILGSGFAAVITFLWALDLYRARMRE